MSGCCPAGAASSWQHERETMLDLRPMQLNLYSAALVLYEFLLSSL